MAYRPLLPQETLRQLLRYEAETGKLFWRERPPHLFCGEGQSREQSCAAWNSRLAGKECFRQIEASGYKCGTLFAKRWMAHRIIWALNNGAIGQYMTIDHINGDRSDNRLENLRAVPIAENSRNMSLRNDNLSGVTGVRKLLKPHRANGPIPKKQWEASIKVNGRSIFLGRFLTKEEAVLSRRSAEKKYRFAESHGKPNRGYRRR